MSLFIQGRNGKVYIHQNPILSPYLLHLEPQNVLGGNRKTCTVSNKIHPDLPLPPSLSPILGQTVVDFEILAFIAFIISFIAFKYIKR